MPGVADAGVRVTRLTAVVLACTLVGCGADAPLPSGAADADTVRMRIAWEVAPGRHPAADSLGLVSGVALDAAGNVYAIDRLAGKVWVFDAQGRLRASVGRKGEGPIAQLRRGLAAARADTLITRVLITISVLSLCSLIFIYQMPLLAERQLDLTGWRFNLLFASFALGAAAVGRAAAAAAR